MTQELQIGFVGLGAMGLPMASNILKAGFVLHAYDVRPEPLEVIRSRGGIPCFSAREVASQSDVVLTMLPDSNSVEQAILGPGGIAEASRDGLVLIEMSTTSLDTIRKVNQGILESGGHVLDAPLSGVPDSAERAELTFIVGGVEGIVEQCRPVLLAMGNKVIRTGDVGSARLAKFVNNMLVTVNMLSSMEILAWARRAGADHDAMVEVVRNGMAYSKVFDYHASSLSTRKEGYLQQHIWLHKDLRLLLEEAEAMGSALPLTAQAKQLLHSARNMSGGAETIGALMSFFDTVAGNEGKAAK